MPFAAVLALVSPLNAATLIFSDNFTAANGTTLAAVNSGISSTSRQDGTLKNNAYDYYFSTSGASISGNKLVNAGNPGFYNKANYKSTLKTVPTSFELSFSLSNTGTNWVSPFLSTHEGGADDRGASRFGLIVFNGTGSLGMYGGTGASQTTTSFSASTLTSLLGSAWNASNTYNYKLVATATTATVGTYDLFINDIKINSTGVAYSLGTTDATVATGNTGLFWVNRNNSGGNAIYDNLQLSVIPEPSAALLGGLGMLALLRRRR